MQRNPQPDYFTVGKWTVRDLLHHIHRKTGRTVPYPTIKRWRKHLDIEPDSLGQNPKRGTIVQGAPGVLELTRAYCQICRENGDEDADEHNRCRSMARIFDVYGCNLATVI